MTGPATIPGHVHADVLGEGPGRDAVLVVHGVGFGPETMEGVAGHLAAAGTAVVVPHRRGYGSSRGHDPVDVAAQVADMVGVLDRVGVRRAHVVGVSGGATIGLALALAHPGRVASAVLHEPALGPLAPGVHDLLGTLARLVAAAPEPGALVGRALAGPDRWERLPAGVRRAVEDAGEVVRREVPHFAAFAPSRDDLGRLGGVPLVTTVGALSAEARRDAAAALARLAGARVAVLPACGHLAQIDAPADLATLAARMQAGSPV